jgi:small subunit ribosomal protein S14
MGMKNLLTRDKKRRKLILKWEHKKLNLKKIINNHELSSNLRWDASLKLSSLPKNSSKTRSKNRCVMTNRGKAIHRHFKISRIILRQLGLSGEIAGFKKSSW